MNNLTKRYVWATAIWFAFMFIFTTFIMPSMGWSDNTIEWKQILVNLVLWAAMCLLVLYFTNKQQANKKKSGDEKMG